MTMHSYSRASAVKVFKRAILAILMAFFLAFLGLFSNLAYHVNSANESIKSSPYSDYMDVTMSLDMTFDPLLYPFYWLTGNGHLSENQSGIVALPEPAQPPRPGYHPPSHHRNLDPIFPFTTTKEERLETFIMIVATREAVWNFVSLLLVTAVIEIAKERLIYWVLFSGILGFCFGAITGMIGGLIVGTILAILYRFKLAKFNSITKIFFSHEAQQSAR